MSLNRAADRENARWPEQLTPVSIEPSILSGIARLDNMPKRAWRSCHFLVQQFEDAVGDGGARQLFTRLSVQRVEHACFRTDQRDKPISWDELMEVKRQCGFADEWAVEVYPPDEHVVNRVRMRHLWIVEEARLPFSWRKGRSGRSGVSAAALLEPDGEEVSRG